MTPDEYCREIEAYLTRKNDGHLIRIVGPGFRPVRGWAEQGVPFKIAYAGIDRYVRALLRERAAPAAACTSITASTTCSTRSTRGAAPSASAAVVRREARRTAPA